MLSEQDVRDFKEECEFKLEDESDNALTLEQFQDAGTTDLSAMFPYSVFAMLYFPVHAAAAGLKVPAAKLHYFKQLRVDTSLLLRGMCVKSTWVLG